MIIVNPDKTKTNNLKEIWKICFDDTDEYINLFFDKIYPKSNCIAICENDKIVSSFYILPSKYINNNNEYKCGYIYAVGTLPEYRNNGYAKKSILYAMEKCKDFGYDFLFLVPASKSLFGFYEKIGFENSFYLEEIDFQIKGNSDLKVEKSNFKEYYLYRNSYLKNIVSFIDWDKKYAHVFDEFANLDDIDVLKIENSFAVCSKEKDFVLIKEILNLDNFDNYEIALAIGSFYNVKDIKMRLPTKNPLFPVAMAYFKDNIKNKANLFLPYVSLYGD